MLEADLHARASITAHRSPPFLMRSPTAPRLPRSLRERFPGFAPRDIARELQVPIVATDDDPMVGSIWRFAEYRPRPPRIVLYTRGLAPLEQALVGGLAAQLLGRATTQDVFVAHELYHHAEAIRSEVPIARRYQATLLQIGKWRWRTGIATLAEIAAGSFAQTLLDLPCHPKVLDYFAPVLRDFQTRSKSALSS